MRVLSLCCIFLIVSSPEPKALGELIVYQWSVVHRPTVVHNFKHLLLQNGLADQSHSWSGIRPSVVVSRHRSQCSKIFFSETALSIKAKFNVEPPWVGGTKVCSRHLGHMTKMAATPIYGKNPSKIFFSSTGGPIFTKLGM